MTLRDYKFMLEEECPEKLNEGKISKSELSRIAKHKLGYSYKKMRNINTRTNDRDTIE